MWTNQIAESWWITWCGSEEKYTADHRAREKDHSGESAVVQQDVLTNEIAGEKSAVVRQLILLFGHSYKKTFEILCSHKIQETEGEQEE